MNSFINCIEISSQINVKLKQLNEIKKLILDLIKCKKILNKNDYNLSELRKCENNLISNLKLCKISANYEVLNERKEIIKNDKYLKCFWPKCDYKTKRLDALKLHKVFHSNEKCFKCDFNNCNKMFKTKCNLNTHKLI